ncbi:MAG: outer membrane beta-barrel protein [Solirubrobacteraceae bacterium]
MKKVLIFFLLTTYIINAQKATFGLKGGYNIIADNTTSLNQINTNLKDKASPNVSFLGGVFLNLEAISGFFIQPEVYFNQLRNDYKIGNESFSIINKRIDVPILFGKKISIIRFYAGPVFSTYLADKIMNTTIKSLKNEEFKVGLQYGVGINLGKVVTLDARYDHAISERTLEFFTTSEQFKTVNNRLGFIQLSVGYILFN